MHKYQGWTVFHLPSTLGPFSRRIGRLRPRFKGMHFDLVVLLPGSLDGMHRVNHGASMAR